MSTNTHHAFYVELGMRSLQGGGERLYYKRDRQSWGAPRQVGAEKEDDTVVKLNVLQIYTLTLTVRPGRAVKYMWLDGQKLELKNIPHPYSDDDRVKYTSQWTTTDYDVTKPRQRKKINIEIEFTSGEFLKTEMQVKFYPANDRVHSRVGRLFSLLSLLCHAPEGTFVNLHKKQYL
ncbi:hypothetical protein ACOMHN_034342 [Nucella lapillus]